MYTKGEWELINPMNDEWIVKAHDGLIAVVSRNSLITSMTNKANAHLIAAAPELYRACKRVEQMLMYPSALSSEAKQYETEDLRKALSKADGGK